jgi:hypothetical protein
VVRPSWLVAGLGPRLLEIAEGRVPVRARLLDCGFVEPRIEPRDHLTTLDARSEVGEELGDPAGHLAADLNRDQRGQRAGRRDAPHEIAALDPPLLEVVAGRPRPERSEPPLARRHEAAAHHEGRQHSHQKPDTIAHGSTGRPTQPEAKTEPRRVQIHPGRPRLRLVTVVLAAERRQTRGEDRSLSRLMPLALSCRLGALACGGAGRIPDAGWGGALA